MKKRLGVIFILVTILSASFIHSTYATTAPSIGSEACILIEPSTGKILYEKNSDQKMYPASTTKVLTAILALENCSLDEVATAGFHAVADIPAGYTNAGIRVGESLTIEQLLYALMLASANEAATILAEHIAGSVESFSTMMNSKASELGCMGTHFVNANGIHDDNHYTTAHDLALIARYAMENETFRKIVSTQTYSLPDYESSPRLLKNTNSLIMSGNNSYFYPYATGIKTGFTSQAKNCLIASAKKDNVDLISVVLHAGNTEDGKSQRYLDTIHLFDYGFEQYGFQSIATEDSTIHTISVDNATKDTRVLDLKPQNAVNAFVSKSQDYSNIEPTVTLTDPISAPISEGDVMGQVSYEIDGIHYTTNLVASHQVEKSNVLTYVLFVFIVIFFLLIITSVFKKGRKYSKTRYQKRNRR